MNAENISAKISAISGKQTPSDSIRGEIEPLQEFLVRTVHNKVEIEEDCVNWKLILLLTLFGIALAFAGVLGLPGRYEAIIWPVIFIIYAVIIVRKTTGKYFLHAFLTSIINGVWIGVIHAAFMSTYLANHHVISEFYKTMPLSYHRRIMTVIMGLALGVIMGVIAGLVAYAAEKTMKKKESAPQPQSR